MTIREAISIIDDFFVKYPDKYDLAPSTEFWIWFETLPKAEREPFQKACKVMVEANDIVNENLRRKGH